MFIRPNVIKLNIILHCCSKCYIQRNHSSITSISDIVAASIIAVITNSIKQNEDPLFTGEPIIGIVITVGGTTSL